MIPDSVYLLLLVMLILAAPFASHLDRHLEDNPDTDAEAPDDYDARADEWREDQAIERQRHPA
ncbi:hypothetical protein [Arthrobacter agilis]|uniref:hypothetical protein n=1 Tax=Arthrobacter agilis TaxID=37921 RepID=UPI002785A146|nr:hypothetical protein [Arthrobacter agilis]MDQ0735306.1 hypothetical protein [Arthrobacter agilis]